MALLKNRSPDASWRRPGGRQGANEVENNNNRCIFKVFLGGIVKIGAEIGPEIEHQFGATFLTIRRHLGVVSGKILGSFGGRFWAPGRVVTQY